MLKLNAIVGLQTTVDANNHITRLGVTCALCHSTVDNSVMAGIGRRMDGWPNRDLNVGAIIALSPVLAADKKAVYTSWGPGKYDPRYNQDGKNTPPRWAGKATSPARLPAQSAGAYAARTANKAYRTTPLRALWQHAPYFHDGSAATLADVVVHYNRVRGLGLTAEQQRDLVEYLKSL